MNESHRKAYKKWYAKNKESRAKYNREYNKRPGIKEKRAAYHTTPEARAKQKEYRQLERVIRMERNRRYKQVYGITLEQFEQMYTSQEGKCSICNNPIECGGKGTHVDHNHKTNQVRALLCTLCNVRLCIVEDEKEWINKAESYLNKWEV